MTGPKRLIENNVTMPLYGLSVLLLLCALNPANPYGYYILLRWILCAVFSFLAFKFLAEHKENWTWVFAVMACIYNPFFPLHLGRPIWSLVNIATVAVLAVSFVKEQRGDPTDLPEPNP